MKEALSVEDTLKLALEAIEFVHDTGDTQTFDMCYAKPALAAIKKALAQTQEPVAWGVFDDNLHDMFFAKEEAQEMVRLKGDGSTVKPLYTTPPQREFVGLTDEEIDQGLLRSNHALQTAGAWRDGVEWATKQLKEKNT